jgi:hypothetical protein
VVRDYDRICQAENLFTCLNTVAIADSLYESVASKAKVRWFWAQKILGA